MEESEKLLNSHFTDIYLFKDLVKFNLDFLTYFVMKRINIVFGGLGRSTRFCNPVFQIVTIVFLKYAILPKYAMSGITFSISVENYEIPDMY